MYSQTFQIGPYRPVLQAEQSGKAAQGQLAVQDGHNFAWHTRGVFSAHSYQRLTAAAPAGDLHPGDYTINSKQVFCFTNGIYELENGAYQPLYNFNLPQISAEYDLTVYKWSYAYVGTIHYFSHPLVSHLIWYDEHAGTWGEFRDPCWTGPLFGIAHADNRLILQLTDVVGWSEFDDGQAWGSDFYKGIGYQSLALIRYGQPFGVMPYRDGFLTFTKHGIMVSKPNPPQGPDPAYGSGGGGGGDLVFRHEELTFDDLPLGPCAIEHIDEKAVYWICRKGFRTYQPSSGSNAFGAVLPFQEEMSLFYREAVLPIYIDNSMASLDDFCLSYSREIGWLFISSKITPGNVVYNRAHVYQFEIDRWGSFNHEHQHVGFGHGEKDCVAHFYGFLDGTGRYCKVDHVPRDFLSWVKFTPTRLEVPQEQGLGIEAQTSVQELRLGFSKPEWHGDTSVLQKATLTSSWAATKTDHEHVTKCDVLVASGDDANTVVVDENEYAHLLNRTEQIATYTLHTTGTSHTVFVIADEPTYHYDLSHIEVGYFFAGVK